jgi:hypothetical protein
MFFLSNGILEKIQKRGYISGLSVSYSQNKEGHSKIVLRNYENPTIVRLDNISTNYQKSVVILNLFDGKDSLDVKLAANSWNFLNDNDFIKIFGQEKNVAFNENKLLKIGTILIISEYCFLETISEDVNSTEEMLTLLDFSVIGYEEPKSLKQSENLANAPQNYSIANLNTSLNNTNWQIKAKLLKISIIKEFVNKFNGQNGKYIRLQFSDETGIIELAAFNQEIERVVDLQENKVYLIRYADIKMSKSNYQAFEETNDTKTELIVNKKTCFSECEQEEKLFTIFKKTAKVDEVKEEINQNKNSNSKNKSEKSSEFLKINELLTKKDGEIVSVLAVVLSVEEMKEITPKFKSPINLRNFYVTDQSSEKVKVSLWGKQAETIDVKVGFIFILSQVKVLSYQGCCLSVQMNSILSKIDESWTNMPQVNELRSWWKDSNEEEISSSLKRSTTLNNISNKKSKEDD